jgi:hypothetical protein
MPQDTILPSAQYVLRDSLKEFREAIDGLPVEALNWEPAGADTNSIAVLTTHALHSTRSWLSVAMGAALPERDRDSEFLVSASDPSTLLSFFDDFAGQCAGLLNSDAAIDWGATRKTHARPGQAPEEVPAAFALIHALSHLREHVAHVGLTRQLWDQQASGR